MNPSDSTRKFLKNFHCKIISTGKRQLIPNYFNIHELSNSEMSYIKTESIYILEIPESGLENLSRWTEYMDRHFTSDPREFFQRWWEAQETERSLREKHPAVAAAYAEYQTLLTLSANNPEKLKPLTQIPD